MRDGAKTASGARGACGETSRSPSASRPRGTPRRSRSPRRAPNVVTLLCSEDLPGDTASGLERALPAESRERLRRLLEDGTLPKRCFDLESLMSFSKLNAELQERVLVYIESERIFLCNSRSKSGFLVATCDRARGGALDAKGMGAPDPWRQALLAIAVPKRQQVDLVPEGQWIQQHGAEPAKITVDVSADKEVGVGSITLAMALEHSVATVKGRLAAIGVKMPAHKMKLKEASVGFLKDEKTLAFYNLQSGSMLHLVYRTRAGVGLRRDHSDQNVFRPVISH